MGRHIRPNKKHETSTELKSAGKIRGVYDPMRYRMGIFALAAGILVGVSVTGTVMAGAPSSQNGAGGFISRLGRQTISYLRDSGTPRSMREERLRGLLRDGFAVNAIGRFVLGKYRRTTPPETVDEFVRVFEDYIVGTYASQFSRYSGERFDVRQVLKGTNAKDTMVMTHISGKNSREPLRVDFQVRQRNETFKIVDIRVEGVSMVLAQRDEFTTFIGNNGGSVRALIDALKRRTTLARSNGAQ